MQQDLKTGDVSVLVAALRKAPKLMVDARGDVVISSDTSEIDALRARMNQEREMLCHAMERDAVLCQFQRQEHRLGAWHYRLGSNLYGWCVGESLRSNLGGGKWAQTPRGYTLAQAIVWGCDQARTKNVRFSFSLDRLPVDVRAEVLAVVASKA